MIDTKIDNLFKTIKESKEYQDYIKIENAIKKDKDLISLIEEIKNLNKKATILEYKEIDKIIKEKTAVLNSNPLYIEYKNKMDTLNDILSSSSNLIQKYIDEVV